MLSKQNRWRWIVSPSPGFIVKLVTYFPRVSSVTQREDILRRDTSTSKRSESRSLFDRFLWTEYAVMRHAHQQCFHDLNTFGQTPSLQARFRCLVLWVVRLVDTWWSFVLICSFLFFVLWMVDLKTFDIGCWLCNANMKCFGKYM